MNAASSIISDLASALGEGLGSAYSALPLEGYAVIVHPDFGIAAVVPSDNEDEAVKAAADLTARVAGMGIVWPAMHFALSVTMVRPPWVIRAGTSMAVDIVSAMASASRARPPFNAETGEKIIAGLTLPAERPSSSPVSKHQLSPNLLRLLEACVEKALKDETPWVATVQIDVKDVVAPNFMLPAILIHAAELWSLPVVANKGNGGFLIRLSADPKSILGYRVTGLDASAPVLLFLPIVHLIRRSFAKGECVLDESVQVFSDFLAKNDLDPGVLADVDIRVASTA